VKYQDGSCQNYEAVSEFVKVMPRIPSPFFPGHGVDFELIFALR